MTPRERTVDVNGHACRVWDAGEGERVGFLAGLGGLPRWTPFLDRLAASRRVVVPSLPGFPGAVGHEDLDEVVDWIAATLDLLEASDLDGADLIGASVGGMLAAEVAALSRSTVRSLVLVAPFGLFDASEPAADPFAQKPREIPGLLVSNTAALAERDAAPDGADELEWQIMLARAREAAARLLWPLGERGLAKRLHRIVAPTLVVWGTDDRLIPASYARRFAGAMRNARVATLRIDGAGHLVDIDRPDELAAAILRFLESGAVAADAGVL